jgi:hypothetical protein
MGFDLSRYKRLVFWARADHPRRINFKVGGIDEPYGDSQHYPVSAIADIGTTWKQFVIDVNGANQNTLSADSAGSRTRTRITPERSSIWMVSGMNRRDLLSDCT